ncbi:MAG: LETM1-related biofilm-associated protein [Bacteroidota bacterium]
MIAPGSKGWVNKYFELLSKEHFNLDLTIPLGFTEKEMIHFSLLRTGIIFGVPAEMLFAKGLNESTWTKSEKLKLLLLESLLLMYHNENKDKEIDSKAFKQSLLDFYSGHSSPIISKVFRLFMSESPDEKLENILSSRLNVKYKMTDSKYWVNYLSNAFIYLDVILYREFLRKKEETLSLYSELAENALTAITMAAFSDNKITEKEKTLFKVFLDSSSLDHKHKALAKVRFKNGVQVTDFTDVVHQNWLFRRFLMDISALTIFVNQELIPEEYEVFENLYKFLDVPKKEVNYSLALIENFVLQYGDKEELLSSASSYEKLYGNLTKRWIKILGRNKEKLAKELKESKDLVYLITKSTKEELTKEEKELVKSQFLDLVRSVPALAIFMLPGGAIILPIILKILPDLIPTAFRDNELEEKK